MKARYARRRAEDMRERALRCRARLERGEGSGKGDWTDVLAALIDREGEPTAGFRLRQTDKTQERRSG